MNKKLLCCALLGALGLSQAAMAQDFDDRWYLTGSVGYLKTDRDRNIKDDTIYGIGFGRMLSSRYSLDLEAERASPDRLGLEWRMTSLTGTLRRHFREQDSNWWPYVAVGLGTQRHTEYLHPTTVRKGGNWLAKFGFGIQSDQGPMALRAELGLRSDQDDDSVAAPGNDRFWDTYLNLTAVFKLGAASEPAPAPAPPPPPAKPSCADLDSDGDGVNDCNDRCPNTAAGTVVGPDGCPVPLTIDLKGVNFDFDKSVLRPDAVAILNEAIEILKKYPQMRVEVAGHTDSTGPENYNQKLSERRAKAVYDHLTSNGIDASRLVGPVGYGELRPIDTNDTREGRARNRRTELNVQN